MELAQNRKALTSATRPPSLSPNAVIDRDAVRTGQVAQIMDYVVHNHTDTHTHRHKHTIHSACATTQIEATTDTETVCSPFSMRWRRRQRQIPHGIVESAVHKSERAGGHIVFAIKSAGICDSCCCAGSVFGIMQMMRTSRLWMYN